MKKKLLIMTVAILLAGGCRADRLNENHRRVVDDYAEIILPQDQDSYEYDRALEAVGAYLTDSGQETLENAKSVLQETMVRFQGILEKDEKRELSKELKKSLEACAISTEDYRITHEFRRSFLDDYTSKLEVLCFYLDAELSNYPCREELEEIYEWDIEMQELNRRSEFCSINYLFADWGKKPVAYFYEKIGDNMKSYTSDGLLWETDRKEIEDEILAYYSQMEAVIRKMSSRIGKENEEMLQMEREQRKLSEG